MRSLRRSSRVCYRLIQDQQNLQEQKLFDLDESLLLHCENALTTEQLLFPELLHLQPVEAGGEHAHRVVADPHRAPPGPEEEPRQLAVAEQRPGAEVPGGRREAAVRSRVAPSASHPHESPSDTSAQGINNSHKGVNVFAYSTLSATRCVKRPALSVEKMFPDRFLTDRQTFIHPENKIHIKRCIQGNLGGTLASNQRAANSPPASRPGRMPRTIRLQSRHSLWSYVEIARMRQNVNLQCCRLRGLRVFINLREGLGVFTQHRLGRRPTPCSESLHSVLWPRLLEPEDHVTL
ncbi:hypothetical protein EYF80_055619 [Liparis tanakae]|uniref:Uncharacterized protein n=1 Tax=Liparis tanakae TaxID=230148 RepID=A0A4Z2EZ20_9TELE|nr:hypothetical protein EYF80_055619 [Liparis tanakae]